MCRLKCLVADQCVYYWCIYTFCIWVAVFVYFYCN